MTSYNLFPGAAPALMANADNAVSLGTSFRVSAPGWVTQIRFPSGSGASYRVEARIATLWRVNVTGGATYSFTRVAGPFTMPAPAGQNQWVAFDLPVPYALTPGQLYRVAVWHPTGGYVLTPDYFKGTTDRSYGIVTVPAAGNMLEDMQGTFKYTSFPDSEAPDSAFNGSAYYSDVTIADRDPAVVSNVFGADGTAYKAFTLVGGILTEVIPTP